MGTLFIIIFGKRRDGKDIKKEMQEKVIFK